jgi:ANTAR domain
MSLASLPRSVEALASLALKLSAADGYSIHEISADPAERTLKLEAGLSDGTRFRFPLGDAQHSGAEHSGAEHSGEVVFICGAGIRGDRDRLERIAHAIDRVWRLSRLSECYAREAARIGALEAELADSKIAERAQGLLASSSPDAEAIETILQHVASVLRPSEIETSLGQFARDLAQQMAERELTSRAKAVLQDRYGLSEEQAHAHLRVVSRTSRKRLRDVAQAVIANPESGAKGLSV